MIKNILNIWVILFITSCEPERFKSDDHARWYVKNNLEYPIKVLIRTYDGTKQIIFPKDSICVMYAKNKTYKDKTYFDLLYSEIDWGKLNEQDQRLDIVSEKGEVLKTWDYKKKGESGKQFFDEEYWKLYKQLNVGPVDASFYDWVFEIVPEDVTPNK